MILILLMIGLCDREISGEIRSKIMSRSRSNREARLMLIYLHMQATQPPRTVFLPKITRKRPPQPAKPSELRMTNYVVDEINAYVVIRDIALAEAEKEPTSENLERARIANDFVENCVKPARPPYEAQHLPETDAARERGNCQAVKVRLSLLHAHLNAIARDQVDAAEAAVPLDCA